MKSYNLVKKTNKKDKLKLKQITIGINKNHLQF